MGVYRNQVRIIADILETTRDYGNGNEGIGITLLLRKANLSYSRLVRILRELLKTGLIEEVNATHGNRYRISDRGIQFLRAYSTFEEFAESFGLRL